MNYLKKMAFALALVAGLCGGAWPQTLRHDVAYRNWDSHTVYRTNNLYRPVQWGFYYYPNGTYNYYPYGTYGYYPYNAYGYYPYGNYWYYPYYGTYPYRTWGNWGYYPRGGWGWGHGVWDHGRFRADGGHGGDHGVGHVGGHGGRR